MSKTLEYDIRADGRVWLDDEPVDASEYPVLDHIIRALDQEGLARFTNYPLPDRDSLYAPDGSWVVWSDEEVSCRVDPSKVTLEDMHYCMDGFKTFVPILNEGALDRTGAALGPLEVTLDFDYGNVLLFRDRTDKVAHFSDDGPDDRPLSKHLADWGTRLQAAVHKAGALRLGRRLFLGEASLRNPAPEIRDALLSSFDGRQDPETILARGREIATILTELPNLLEELR